MKRDKRPNLFTVGYARLTPAELKSLVDGLDVVLVDVRSRPSGRVKRGFARVELQKLLGDRYEWWPDLGGFGPGPSVDALGRLAADKRRLLLMCAEESPGQCHRHGIALSLAARGVVVHHVFRDEVIDATELQRAIDHYTEYEYTELADVIAGAARR